MVFKQFLPCVGSVKADLNREFFPRRPAGLEFRWGLDKLTVQRLVKYQKIPVDRPIGPALESPDYERSLEVIASLKFLRWGLQHGLDRVYEDWCDLSCDELRGAFQSYPDGRAGGVPYLTVEIRLADLLVTKLSPTRSSVKALKWL
eukprot:8333202-Pyramimonas_sp.AAC.1